MKPTATIVAVTGHDKLRHGLLDRAESLGRDTGATVILFDRDADQGPLMSPLPTAWSADGEQEQFGNRLDSEDLETAGQAALAEQVRSLRAVGVDAFGWLPSKANAEALANYASRQGARKILVSAQDEDLVDGLKSMSDAPMEVEVVPSGEPWNSLR